jgi:hypothetical protein
MMEGKFSGEGIHSLEADEDMMSAMARELVERGGVGESANAIWQDLKRERALQLPEMPAFSVSHTVEADDDSILESPSGGIAPLASPALTLASSPPKNRQKSSSLWPTGYKEGEQLLLFA